MLLSKTPVFDGLAVSHSPGLCTLNLIADPPDKISTLSDVNFSIVPSL